MCRFFCNTQLFGWEGWKTEYDHQTNFKTNDQTTDRCESIGRKLAKNDSFAWRDREYEVCWPGFTRKSINRAIAINTSKSKTLPGSWLVRRHVIHPKQHRELVEVGGEFVAEPRPHPCESFSSRVKILMQNSNCVENFMRVRLAQSTRGSTERDLWWPSFREFGQLFFGTLEPPCLKTADATHERTARSGCKWTTVRLSADKLTATVTNLILRTSFQCRDILRRSVATSPENLVVLGKPCLSPCSCAQMNLAVVSEIKMDHRKE